MVPHLSIERLFTLLGTAFAIVGLALFAAS